MTPQARREPEFLRRCPACGAPLIQVLEPGGSTTDGHPLSIEICSRRRRTGCL